METLTIPLTTDQLDRLRERATQQHLSLEEMASAGLEQWLTDHGLDFEEAARRALEKNAELYHRLA